jgi:uncharacterized Tic20 family protein
VQQEPDNYGRQTEPVTTSGVAVSPQDERTWSILAHLSVLINLITGIGGPIAALVIWLVYREKSSKISFHSLQSLWYQIAWAVILTIGWTITFILTIVVIGFLLIPVMLVLSLVPFVHQCYAAYRISQGEDYRYPFIADMIGGERNPS